MGPVSSKNDLTHTVVDPQELKRQLDDFISGKATTENSLTQAMDNYTMHGDAHTDTHSDSGGC